MDIADIYMGNAVKWVNPQNKISKSNIEMIFSS